MKKKFTPDELAYLESRKDEYKKQINELTADCDDVIFLRQIYTIMIRRAKKEGWR